MTEVFLVEKGQLTAASRRDLRAAGIVVAEVDDLSKAQFVRAGEVVSGSDMLWAVLDALNARGKYESGDREAQSRRLQQNLLTVVNAARSDAGSEAVTR